MLDFAKQPHIRKNILTGEYILVSPHRMNRPWQGKIETIENISLPSYDGQCYLCPCNKRSGGEINPNYKKPFAFTNDFSALLSDTKIKKSKIENLLISKSQKGICRVICFSPNHSLALPLMTIENIVEVIDLWQEEFKNLSQHQDIKYIQIFENKGKIMGCSNPHPHGQIWTSSFIPLEILKETKEQKKYFKKYKQSLLSAYIKVELSQQKRIILENENFVALVPFWAVWPYETMIISKRHIQHINQLTEKEKHDYASILKIITTKYDNLFKISFPYSAGIHQAPINDGEHIEWHWHMHFYPPLLRSATIKKFMVGYEMLANGQRDITPEYIADILKKTPDIHYTNKPNT